MHIVYTTSEFFTDQVCGGLGTYLDNISKIFRDRGHEITIITLSWKLDRLEWDRDIMIERANPYRGKILHECLRNHSDRDIQMIAARLENSHAFCNKINEINKRHPIDIIQDRGNGFSYYRDKKIPLAVMLANNMPYVRLAYHKEFCAEPGKKDINRFEKFCLRSMRNADGIFASARVTAENVGKLIHRKIEVIESPVDINKESLDESLYQERFKNKKYLMFYGTLGYLKGVHIIAEVIYEFLEKYKEFYFLFAGKDYGAENDGRKIPMLELVRMKAKEHADRVLYVPDMDNKAQLYALVRRAYACVLPSRVDNLPNTCMEAMSLGKVVIGTEGASFEQLIEDKRNGLLVSRESPAELMAAINYLMALPPEKLRRMENSAEETVKRLSPEVIYRNLLSFYMRVIENR